MSLTFAYVTTRKEPRIEWFLRSLNVQRLAAGMIRGVDLITISSHPIDVFSNPRNPKPSVWQGPHRLTSEDWFSAGNARNTALCLAKGSHIAFVDDLSVLTPGWLAAAIDATKFDGITCGAYRKVKCLRPDEDGRGASFEDFPAGWDNRWKHLEKSGWNMREPYPCGGQWMYGCSLVAPIEAFLRVNGWCEDLCGGLGFEDCITGIVLENAGVKFRYDPRMLTLESEEDHHVEKPMRKSDYGVSPNDKSHKALEIARTLKRFDNGFDLRAMRERVLNGLPFPVPTEPKIEWFSGTPLSEL
jgi:glycosyltransferase involved in cell wall biosynthesis